MSKEEAQAHFVKLLRSIADEIEAGRSVALDFDLKAEDVQLVPLPDEEWVMRSATGRFLLKLEYVAVAVEAKHAQTILSRMEQRT